MATQDQFSVQMDRLNEATNQLAAKLTSLQDQIAGAGLPQEVEDSVLAQLTSAADALNAMANPKAKEDDAEQPIEVPTKEDAIATQEVTSSAKKSK